MSHSYYQLLHVKRFIAGNLQAALNEWRAPSPSAFISPPWVRKCQCKWLNSLDTWPTVLTALAPSFYAKMPVLISVKYYMTFLPWDTHSAQGCASLTVHEARSRVGAYSNKLWPYTRNWPKNRGWALFREWTLFHETMVLSTLCITTATANL